MIRRPPRSTPLYSSAASDVYKRQEHVLPPDVKVVPYYDRQSLIAETTTTVEDNLLRGMLLVLVILGLFLFSVRTALIVAITIPFALMFSFICLDWRHIPANFCLLYTS